MRRASRRRSARRRSAAPPASSSRTSAAAAAPARLPTSASIGDLALEQVRDLEVGRADAVHHLDREAVRVERAARGQHHRRRRRRAEQQRPEPKATPLQQPKRAQQRRRRCRGGRRSARRDAAADPLLRSPRDRRWRATSKLISAGTGRSAARGRRARASARASCAFASGTASGDVTPGADRPPGQRARLAPPPGPATNSGSRSPCDDADAVLASASPAAAMIIIAKLMIAITHGVGPRNGVPPSSRRSARRGEQPAEHQRRPAAARRIAQRSGRIDDRRRGRAA